MADDNFEDLLDGVKMLADSSQESLTNAAANLAFCESDEEILHAESQTSADATFSGGYIAAQDEGLTKTQRAKASQCKTTSASVSPYTPVPPSQKAADAGVRKDTSDRHDRTVSTKPNSSVLDKIEAVFEQIADDILNERTEIGLSLNVRLRQPPPSGVGHNRAVPDTQTKHVCFPGKTAEEAWRFRAPVEYVKLTILGRDMYYRDPALFGSQSHVDRYVDDIAYTFGVPRSALNVTAVAKGLVAGALSICRRDGSVVSTAADGEGMLVPSLKDVLSVNLAAVKWVIVVEKEASFRSIAASSFRERLSTEGVLITGKGYPDIATRALLRYICTPSPQNGFASPPSYALVDFDPDGLAIMSVYRDGSAALAHESADLRVSQLRWLGLRSEHMLLGGDGTHASQGLLSLTVRDRGKARKMLERGASGDESEEAAHRTSLQVMLMLNIKAELQLLDAEPSYLTDLLEGELDGLTI